METVTFEDFEKIDIRVGRVIEVADYPEARNPSYKTNPAPSSRPPFTSKFRTGKQADGVLNVAQDTEVVFLVRESATADAAHGSPSLLRPKRAE
jgi:hypothetical protein